MAAKPPQRTVDPVPLAASDDDYLRWYRVNKQLPSGPPLTAEQERYAGQMRDQGLREMENVMGRDKQPTMRQLLRRR